MAYNTSINICKFGKKLRIILNKIKLKLKSQLTVEGR